MLRAGGPMRVGRNELCPCGSGKKYKNCCESKDARGSSRGMLGLLGVIALIAAVGIFAALSGRGTKSAPRPTAGGAAAPAGTTPRPQPPGPAPAGKVWSAEHGHWHDANPAAGGGAPTTVPAQPAARTPVPQPPGTPPPGKVWSPEHGHWH